MNTSHPVYLLVFALILAGCQLSQSHVAPCDDGGTSADAEACVPGTKSCLAEDVEQVCIGDGDGGTSLEVHACEEGAPCIEGQGCVVCMDECEAGTMACAEDMTTVLSCLPAGPAGCLKLMPVLDCTTVGLSACVPPDGGGTITDPQEYCVNECGGRNLPLEHMVCEPHDAISCAVWVCDPATRLLQADHAACLPGGSPCQEDSECLNCYCDNGTCIGNSQRSCDLACR